MSDDSTLREMVSHRLTFELDNGTRITGYLHALRPARGPVQLARLSHVLLFGPTGDILGRHDELSVVPNLLVSLERDPANACVTLEVDTGAHVVGRPQHDALSSAGLMTLAEAVIHSADGQILAREDRLTVATRPVRDCRITEGPLGG
jgi:hypothetical protein